MAIRRIDLLSCGNLDKTPMKTLDFDAREFSTLGRSMLRVSQGFWGTREQRKKSKGTREHEPILGNGGTKTLKLEDENILT